jgi:hypothetical protein
MEEKNKNNKVSIKKNFENDIYVHPFKSSVITKSKNADKQIFIT